MLGGRYYLYMCAHWHTARMKNTFPNFWRVAAFTLFILANTDAYWEDGMFLLWGLIVLLFLTLVYGIVYIVVMGLLKDDFLNRSWFSTLVLMVCTLLQVLLFRNTKTLADWQSKDIFIATREGAASCATTLYLKSDKRFVLRGVCFGVDKVEGVYKIQGDTIFLVGGNYPDSWTKHYRFCVFNRASNPARKPTISVHGDVGVKVPDMTVYTNELFK